MNVKSLTPILNVSDVPASILWFERIGWKRGFAWNEGGMMEGAALSNEEGPAHFGSVCSSGFSGEDALIFLCKDGQGSRDPRPFTDPESDAYGGVWMSWWVPDVDAAHEECQKVGAEVVRAPCDEPWGVREFLLRHPDGHYFRVSGPVAHAVQ